jgi:hypothetical protein
MAERRDTSPKAPKKAKPKVKAPKAAPAASKPAAKPRAARRPAVEDAPSSEVSHEEIRVRAYYIALEEGGKDDVENWLRAERDLAVR